MPSLTELRERDLLEWRVRHHLYEIEVRANHTIWQHRHRDAAAGLDADAPGLAFMDIPPEPESRNMRAIRRKRELAVRRVLRQIPKVLEAAETGDAWAAAEAALDLLARIGSMNIKDAENIRAGRRQQQAGSRGGVAKRGKVHRTHRGKDRNRPSNETICEAVEALRVGKRKWSKACQMVAGRIGMSGRQVQRISEPVKW
jgi:hypothetical protein